MPELAAWVEHVRPEWIDYNGHLSEAYIIGMTHVKEAVEQLRGTAINQVADAEIALVTGGPSSIPVSAILLRR